MPSSGWKRGQCVDQKTEPGQQWPGTTATFALDARQHRVDEIVAKPLAILARI
jgi:hypothetical protein